MPYIHTVSYTHLDVYKRQIFIREGFPNNETHLKQYRHCTGQEEGGEMLVSMLPWSPLWTGRTAMPAVTTEPIPYTNKFYMCAPRAVSYTHLDVYKRQIEIYTYA